MPVTTLPTDSHDKLELYLSKNYVVVDFMRIAKDRKFPALRDKKITSRLLLERTIGGKTMDCLILSIIDGEKRIFDVKSVLTLLIDVKPRMNRIGAMLAQINLYSDILSNQKNNAKQGYSIYRRVMKLIVTTDINEDYDRMMIDQDVFLLYLAQNIVDNNLKIPKAALSRRDRYLTSAEQVGKKKMYKEAMIN